MLDKQGDTRSLVRDQALAPVECDVPVGWSLEDWRTVRGLAREATREAAPRRWRRRLRASR